KITVLKTYSMGNHDPYLFSSLIKCPWCGNNYTGYRKKHKLKNGGENIYIKYRCGNKFNRHSCAHLTEHKIEEYMLTHVSARLDEELAQIEFDRQQRANHTENPEVLRDEMDRLNILFQKGRITERYYDEQYELLEKKLSEIDKASKYLSQESYGDLIRAFSGNWQDLYLQLDKPHKQAFWKSTIKDIQIDKETHQICGFNFLANLE
ncbi:MAG: recombinase zinc beta ribbon domain-containing protein, partial [Lachnospiraceae bacterium]|nr:recombinase zinc beta ribbon domain-containing protein [Lachnospiraceae bacterium]